jgi:hypothetical protein
MSTIDQIEDQICKAIRGIEIDSLSGDRKWAKAIFKALADLGTSLNYEICSSSNDGEYDAGWLFDLVWYQNDENGRLFSVPLVLESEWHRNYERIKYDFEKLLIAKAQYKVMIFQAKGEKKAEYFNRLEAGIGAFHIACKSESYLLVCFDEDLWVFEIRTVKIDKFIHVTKVTEVVAQPAT